MFGLESGVFCLGFVLILWWWIRVGFIPREKLWAESFFSIGHLDWVFQRFGEGAVPTTIRFIGTVVGIIHICIFSFKQVFFEQFFSFKYFFFKWPLLTGLAEECREKVGCCVADVEMLSEFHHYNHHYCCISHPVSQRSIISYQVDMINIISIQRCVTFWRDKTQVWGLEVPRWRRPVAPSAFWIVESCSVFSWWLAFQYIVNDNATWMDGQVRYPLIYHRSTQLSKAKSQLISIADLNQLTGLPKNRFYEHEHRNNFPDLQIYLWKLHECHKERELVQGGG